MESLKLEKDFVRQQVKTLNGQVTISLNEFFKTQNDIKTIGSFKEMTDEPQLKDFPLGVDICWPWIENKSESKMSFHASNKFKPSQLGFKEPVEGAAISKSKIQILFIPGQAFDFKGNRLGRGKGYYDRYLEGYKGIKVGVCSQERFLTKPLPVDLKRDVPVDWVVTESVVYRVNPYGKAV